MNTPLDALREELSSLSDNDASEAELRGNDDLKLGVVLLRRINEFESGNVLLISSEQVFADLERVYP